MINNCFCNPYKDSKIWIWKKYKISWNVYGEDNRIPIIFIHGFGASSAHWRYNLSYFAKNGYAVYVFDLIGFGNSAQPGIKEIGLIDNSVWCDQVKHFINEIIRPRNSNKIFIIGNSLGSLVALTSAVNMPKEIGGIIASPLPDPINLNKKKLSIKKRSKNYMKIIIKIILLITPIELILLIINKFGVINIALRSAYFKTENIDKYLIDLVRNPSLRHNAAKSLRAMCLGMLTRRLDLTASYLMALLNKKGGIPFLLLWGEKDNFIPLFLGKRIANLYPWVELKVIPNSGHCVHDEDPHIFNKISYQWIKKINPF